MPTTGPAGRALVSTYRELVSPEPNRPLIPSEVVRGFAASAREYGCNQFVGDSHYLNTARVHAALVGVQLHAGGTTEETLIYLRETFREGKLKIPPDKQLIAQLKSVMFKPRTGGGITVMMPRSVGAGHADLVSALAQAVHFDRRFGPFSADAPSMVPEVIRGASQFQGFVATTGGGFQSW
ncbi:MAG: hypothetical protein NVS3B20_19980 [Polyangiales bacterium]